MNQAQVEGTIRQILLVFGGTIAGWFAAKGWLSTEQVMLIINSPTVISLIGTAIVAVWGFFSRTDKKLIASVDAMPTVQGVVMKATPAGHDLAQDIPSPTVVVAGTNAATAVAQK